MSLLLKVVQRQGVFGRPENGGRRDRQHGRLGYLSRIPAIAAIACLCWTAAESAHAQAMSEPDELADTVYVDEADASVRSQFARAAAQIFAQQWDDAVETLLQIRESSGGKLIPDGKWRYRNASAQCQAMLAALPDEGLAAYRRRVDSEADQAISSAKSSGNLSLLRLAVDDYLCSTPADAAQMELADLALEHGDYATARLALSRMLPQPPVRVARAAFEAARDAATTTEETRVLLTRRYRLDESDSAPSYRLQTADRPLGDDDARELTAFWRQQNLGAGIVAYPDSRQDFARVRALLTLTSIHEGALRRAEEELAYVAAMHPMAEGALEGNQVRYADRLKAMLSAARGWASQRRLRGWPTLGGSFDRAGAADKVRDVGPIAWEPIEIDPISVDPVNAKLFRIGAPMARSTEFASYHPIVTEGTIFWCNQQQVFAFDLRTGTPRYEREASVRRGLLFDFAGGAGRGPQLVGIPRFTLSAADGRLYARLGTSATGRSAADVERRSLLVCLDLATAKTVWDLTPGDDSWAFESEPVVDGDFLYVAMRHSEVRPQLHVACYEQPTLSSANRRSPKLRWRTLVASAETAAGGMQDEATHQLLTLQNGTIYCSTNLGVIGAVDAETGRIRWVTRYPRIRRIAIETTGHNAPLLTRDLCPALASDGRVFCAPADGAVILALDATNGELMWSAEMPADVSHFLGASGDELIVGGDQLRWYDADNGRLRAAWPDQPRGGESMRGYGRGLLAGDQVLWPTRGAIYVFSRRLGSDDIPRMERTPIAIAALHGISGGNLLVADGYLVVASSDKIIAFRLLGQEAMSK